jgi:hypothetical protein
MITAFFGVVAFIFVLAFGEVVFGKYDWVGAWTALRAGFGGLFGSKDEMMGFVWRWWTKRPAQQPVMVQGEGNAPYGLHRTRSTLYTGHTLLFFTPASSSPKKKHPQNELTRSILPRRQKEAKPAPERPRSKLALSARPGA